MKGPSCAGEKSLRDGGGRENLKIEEKALENQFQDGALCRIAYAELQQAISSVTTMCNQTGPTLAGTLLGR